MFEAVQTFFSRFAKEKPPLTPFQEGAKAIHTKYKNPYKEGTPQYGEWERGYEDAFSYWSW